MLPASFPAYRAEVAAEQPVHASDRRMADATAMVVDRTPYMLSASATNATESDEKTVEMFLVQGLEDDKRRVPITRPLESHQDTAHAGRRDSMVNVERCPSTSDLSTKTLPGRAPETVTRGDDGLFLLKRSAHYTSRLSVNTLSTSETTQLKRDIALWRMAKSSSPPVEPSPPQLLPPPPAQSLIHDCPAHIPSVHSTTSNILSSTEPPERPTGSIRPDNIPPMDLGTTSSGILATIGTAAEEDVAMSIESSHLPEATAPYHAHSASDVQSTTIILRSEPSDEGPSVATGTTVPASSAAMDDLVETSGFSLCPVPTGTLPTDAVSSLAGAPGCSVLITPFDLPHDQLVPRSTNGLEATFYLAALDTTLIEELDRASVSPGPATSAQRPVEEGQATDNTLETECLLADEIPLLTDELPTVPTDTNEPCYADAQSSHPLTSPPGPVPLLAPVIELASDKVNIDIADKNVHASAGPRASSMPLSELPSHVERELGTIKPIDKAEPTVEDVAQADVTSIVCTPSATQDGLASSEVVQSNPADALSPIPTPEATLRCADVLPPILPVSLSSSVLPLCVTPSEAEVVSLTPQSRECSPNPDLKMEVETAHPVASDDPTTVLPLDPVDDIVMEVDPFNDLDTAEITTSVEGIPEFADADLDLPSSSPPASSSPPYIFSSSPPRDFYGTPPSSSPPVADLEQSYPDVLEHKATAETQNDALVNDEWLKCPAPDVFNAALEEERTPKRVKTEPLAPSVDLPLPKRLTQASVAKQRKKLAAPFRSPVIKGPLVQGGLHAVYATGRALMPPPLRKAAADDAMAISPHETADVRPDPTSANKDRTANAAKQFKSPLVGSSTAASASGTLFSSAKSTPTIQALQGKLQTLKQAIRIKNSGKEDKGDELERLVAKWTTAGREVAWAVWDYVKDLDPGTDAAVGQSKGGWSSDGGDFWGAKAGEKRGFEPGWGYDDEHAQKKARTDGGVEAIEEEEDDALPVMQHTLGTMLRHMSIDPATLGWDEEEGDFVDV